MRIESWAGVTAVLLAMFGSVIAAGQQHPLSSLPANVKFPRELEPAIRRIYERSPTFRAQCERIAADERLRVTVQLDTSIPGGWRAFTIVQRRRSEIRAQMHLPPSSDHSELLGHEFEHLIEQIEGLDLKTLARIKGSGVRESEYALFETERAKAAGRVVAAEAGRWSRRAPEAD
jgi:hypothetical protein